MMDAKKLLTTVAGPDGVSNALKFDGVNDYLARGGALTGVSDSQQGTFGAWVRVDGLDSQNTYLLGSSGVAFYRSSTNRFRAILRNYGGAIICIVQHDRDSTVSHQWVYFIASWDLSVGIIHFYIDDETGFTPFTAPANDTVDYTGSDWCAGSGVSGSSKLSGALQHFFFAPGDYIDLSIESNRRKFCDYDANGQLVPVSLGADGSAPTGNQPAIYLPLTDPLTAGENRGYGGNFTVNGAPEYASTAPDTPSVEAVDTQGVDGNALRRSTALSGVTDSDKFVLSGWFWHSHGIFQRLFTQRQTASGNDVFMVDTGGAGGDQFRFYVRNAAGTLLISSPALGIPVPQGVWFHLLVAADFSTNTLQWYVNDAQHSHGVTLTSGNVNFSGSDFSVPGRWNHIESFIQHPIDSLSEFFFAPGEYIDLSVEANRRLFITADGKPANPRQLHTVSGLSPAIYLPEPAATVEQNLGYGGDFTRNGTLKDARSTPLYYYAEPVTFDGVNDDLTRGAGLTGISDGKAGVFFGWLKLNGGDSATQRLLESEGAYFSLRRTSNNTIVVDAKNSSGTVILSLTSGSTYKTGSWIHVAASWDLSAGAGQLYIDGADDLAASPTLTNDTIDYTRANWAVGASTGGADKANATMAEMFFATSFIDLSVPSNREQAYSSAGRPAGNLIETTGITPAVYLARDPDNWQTNLGSGGNFTVNGALTRGINSPSDVKEVS